MFKKFCDFNLKNGASNVLRYSLNTPFWVIILTKLKILTKNVKNLALNFTTKIIIKNRFQSLQFKSYKQLTVFYEGVTAIIKNVKNRNFPNALVSGKFPKYLQIFECGIFLRFWKFLNWLEISKIPRHLGNSPNTQTFEAFPKYLGFWETPQISSHLRSFQNLLHLPFLNNYRNLGNFPNAWGSGIEISQMPILKKCKCCCVMYSTHN